MALLPSLISFKDTLFLPLIHRHGPLFIICCYIIGNLDRKAMIDLLDRVMNEGTYYAAKPRAYLLSLAWKAYRGWKGDCLARKSIGGTTQPYRIRAFSTRERRVKSTFLRGSHAIYALFCTNRLDGSQLLQGRRLSLSRSSRSKHTSAPYGTWYLRSKISIEHNLLRRERRPRSSVI